MKSSLGEHGLTGQNWPVNLRSDFARPRIVLVVSSCQGYQQTGVGYGIHPRENPLRLETFLGPPLMMPTYLRHA